MNKEKQIRVLLVRPGQYPEERMVDNTLPALQKLVGGDIETVSPWPDRSVLSAMTKESLRESLQSNLGLTTMCWRGIFSSAASGTMTFAV